MSASQLPSKYRWFSTGNLPRNAGFQPASPCVALVFQPANPLLRPYTPTKKSALQTSLPVPLVAKPAIPLPRPHLPTGKSALQTPPGRTGCSVSAYPFCSHKTGVTKLPRRLCPCLHAFSVWIVDRSCSASAKWPEVGGIELKRPGALRTCGVRREHGALRRPPASMKE